MFSFSQAVLNPREKRTRWGFLGLATFPLVGAVVFNWAWQPKISVCPLLNFTGIPCPGCGLTRSFMALVRGDFHQALSFHLFGPLLFITFIGIALCMGLELWRGKRLTQTPFRRFTTLQTWKYLFFAYFIYYGLRLYSLATVGEFYQHPMQLIAPLF